MGKSLCHTQKMELTTEDKLVLIAKHAKDRGVKFTSLTHLYYGVSVNFEGIKNFYQQTRRLTFKWMNRRSQKRSWNWKGFERYLSTYPLPKAKLTYVFYNTW